MLITIHQSTASYDPAKPNYYHWDLRENADDEDPLVEGYGVHFVTAGAARDDAMKFLQIMAGADLSSVRVKYGD